MQIYNIKINEEYNFTHFNANEETIAGWHDNKLPEDNFSVENAIMILKGHRTAYILDPQYQAYDWIVSQNKVKSQYIFENPSGDH